MGTSTSQGRNAGLVSGVGGLGFLFIRISPSGPQFTSSGTSVAGPEEPQPVSAEPADADEPPAEEPDEQS